MNTLHIRLLALTSVSFVLGGSFACDAPSAAITNLDGSELGDDDDDDDDDDDVGTGTGTGTSGTGTTPTEPDAYPRSWQGERELTFEYGWCQDTIYGEGIEVTQEPNWADALAACPECDEIYDVGHTPDRICQGQVAVGNESVKGLNRAMGTIYEIKRTDQGFFAVELSEGTWADDTLEYWYEVQEGWDYYEVDGWVTAE